MGRAVVEAVVVAAVAGGLALLVNGFRPGGLPLVAVDPYETLVPCPEPGGPAEGVAADDPVVEDPHTFLLDARTPDEFAAWHLPGAVNVPYDWLDPLSEETLGELARSVAASRARVVVVYGDGGRPDSGEHLGREISGRGIHNVHFVVGGAAALGARGDR
jgi:rhodanese-related sulfurtransferase